MFNWIKNLFGFVRPVKARQWEYYVSTDRYARLKAKYDAASQLDSRHWANADALSSTSANSLDVRTKLRNRARYEIANNCHARGIVSTLANDVIGTGSRLQIVHDDESLCNAIETPWNEWYEEIGLAEKLHTFKLAKIGDGEGCGMLRQNDQLFSSVRLDVEIFETDRITDPYQLALSGSHVDGIELDERNRPVNYYVSKYHPGDTTFFQSFGPDGFSKVPAKNILHWFRHDRPEQMRGVPEITPALPLFAQIRRYTLAVLASAEIAADFAAFIHTDALPNEEDSSDQPKAWDSTDLEKGLLTPLPHGWDITQMRAEQPTTGHNEFVKGLLREACHALLIPYNIANADFEGDSYAGGRMALQVYQRSCKVQRSHFNNRILNKIFAAWYEEAIRIPRLLPSSAPLNVTQLQRKWHYDAWGHVDPVKESTATGIDLANGVTTLADECEKESRDWRDVMNQRAKEQALAKKLGILTEPTKKAAPSEDDEADGETEDAEVQNAAA
jgi:lambda family phage portal protein